MLRLNTPIPLIEFYDWVNLLLIDDVPFRATWNALNGDYRRLYYNNRVLTIQTPKGTSSFLYTDSNLKQLRYHIKCVLNPSKSLFPKLDI